VVRYLEGQAIDGHRAVGISLADIFDGYQASKPFGNGCDRT
jgi:hypothetical protein